MTPTTAKCPTCDAPISDRMRECPYCGSELYYQSRKGSETIAQSGDKVLVVRHQPAYIPGYASQGGTEYKGAGGTFTRPSTGAGYVLFPSEDEVEEWNNESRRADDERVRPKLARLIYFFTALFVIYTIIVLWSVLH